MKIVVMGGGRMKIVVNECAGVFSVREAVFDELGITDKSLIDAIEKLGGEESSGASASVRVISTPDDVDWCIVDMDGY